MFGFLAAINAITGIAGKIKSDNAANDAERLLASRKAFKTTDEVYDIVAASTNRAQSGFDPATMEYLSGEINRLTASSLGVAKRVGSNANELSAMLDQNIQSIMKVGSANAAANMENYSKYLSAKELLAKNLEAEWASEEGIIKDKLQSANMRRQEGTAQFSAGLSGVTSALSSMKMADLYKERTDSLTKGGVNVVVSGANGTQGATPAATNSTSSAASAYEGIDFANILSSDISSYLSVVGYDKKTGQPIYGKR